MSRRQFALALVAVGVISFVAARATAQEPAPPPPLIEDSRVYQAGFCSGEGWINGFGRLGEAFYAEFHQPLEGTWVTADVAELPRTEPDRGITGLQKPRTSVRINLAQLCVLIPLDSNAR